MNIVFGSEFGIVVDVDAALVLVSDVVLAGDNPLLPIALPNVLAA